VCADILSEEDRVSRSPPKEKKQWCIYMISVYCVNGVFPGKFLMGPPCFLSFRSGSFFMCIGVCIDPRRKTNEIIMWAPRFHSFLFFCSFVYIELA